MSLFLVARLVSEYSKNSTQRYVYVEIFRISKKWINLRFVMCIFPNKFKIYLIDFINEICRLSNKQPHQREALMATLEGSLRAENPRFKNRGEEARFTQRINLFFGRTDAKELADRLMIRDREQDDRRLCLECRHFKPHRLECNNFEWAGFTQPKL